jgi:hypothetical protein
MRINGDDGDWFSLRCPLKDCICYLVHCSRLPVDL